MALKGYHSYRGRQGVWRWLLAIVLVLILAASCAFLFLQRYITYSDDGSFYIDLPFEFNFHLPLFDGEDGEQKEPPQQDFDLIVDPPRDEQTEQDDSQGEQEAPPAEDEEPPAENEEPPAPEQEKPAPYTARRLISLNDLPADEAALVQLLTDEGVDGFVFLAKDREGNVLYQSAAAYERAVAAQGVSREQLVRLCAQPGVYTVARISCLRDPLFALAHINEASIRNKNGFAWFENDWGGHWLEPEKALTREYLISLAVECAELGFDELLLENVCYPYQGNLYKIVWEKEASKTEALFLFLNELKAALEPYGVHISLMLEEDVVRGLAENTVDTGFVPEQLLPLVDAVYVSTNDEDTVQQEMKDLLGGENVPALVSVVREKREQAGWYLIG